METGRSGYVTGLARGPIPYFHFGPLLFAEMRDNLMWASRGAGWYLNDTAACCPWMSATWTYLMPGKHHWEQASPGKPVITIVRLAHFPKLTSSAAIWSPGLSLKAPSSSCRQKLIARDSPLSEVFWKHLGLWHSPGPLIGLPIQFGNRGPIGSHGAACVRGWAMPHDSAFCGEGESIDSSRKHKNQGESMSLGNIVKTLPMSICVLDPCKKK